MKYLCWNCRGLRSPTTIRELKQLLIANNLDIIFLCETKMNVIDFQRVQNRCRMQNGLVVSLERRSGGLVLMWKGEMNVTIQSYSKHHIDSLVKMGRNSNIRVTGYYGHANPSERNSSWDILKSVRAAVNEEWVVGSDFNAVLNDAEKDSGRRIVRAQMNDFRWFTWINNSDGDRLIKERLDRSITSVSMAEKFPFIAPSVIRQSQSDHDAILLDLYSHKPKGHPHDNKIRFRYEECWAVEEDVKSIINKAWEKDGNMCNLKNNINSIIDSPNCGDNVKRLRESQCKLDYLHAREERYWAQRSRAQWLKEGDRNTKYFYAKATGRLKKNSIKRIKDEIGNWVTD
ncbi:hypothetical protein ERO13_A12G210150v2, partial [Gossypium hirsutum]